MIGTNLAITTKNYAVAGGVTYDTDALAYFTANTAITSAADKNAINTFYLGLKTDGIYTKIKAMYLPIWGSAATSKWNLVNPLDTNAAYRLTFSVGGVTYASDGILSNGTSGYANTNFNPSTQSTLNSTHLSFYSQSNTTGAQCEMGNINGSNDFILALRLSGQSISDQYNFNTGRVITASTADARGFFIGSRTLSNTHKLFRNATQLSTTNTGASGTFQNLNIFLLCYNSNGTAGAYTLNKCSFSSIGDGLTDADITNFSNRVNTLMTYFGINRY